MWPRLCNCPLHDIARKFHIAYAGRISRALRGRKVCLSHEALVNAEERRKRIASTSQLQLT